MRCLERFNKKMNYSGGSLRNEIIKNHRELMNQTFEDDASFQSDIVMWELGKKDFDHSPTIPIRFYERAFSNANGSTVKFITPYHSPIDVGDIIYHKGERKFYICTESFNIDNIHWQGKFTLCNWILKWQKSNGEILEYPCYDINSTQYNSGEQSNRQFTIGSSQHMVTLPCDENTIALCTPRRFILDKNKVNPTVFIVTQNDNTSYNYGQRGLVRITLYENVFNPATDRADLGICDYIDTESKVCPYEPVGVHAVIEYKTNILKSGGNSQTFTGKFMDENKKEVTVDFYKWDIICDFKDALVIETLNNQIKISIDDDYYIDEEFKLIFSDKDNRYSDTLIIRIESLL